MKLRVLTWNLYHGRDFPPDRDLHNWRSRYLRVDQRNETHLQVNRDLQPEFTRLLAGAGWDVALLQECPPRWCPDLARATGAQAHRVLTSRNALGSLRALLARQNPDLIGSNEGGSNLTLVRPPAGGIVDRHEVELTLEPERRTMALTRLRSGVCMANLHASTAPAKAAGELRRATQSAVRWAGSAPLVLGGDFNVRPCQSGVFEELAGRHGFSLPSDPEAIDHLLARGLTPIDPPRAWPPEAREVSDDGLAIRLSDHAPVEAAFEAPIATPADEAAPRAPG